MDRETKKIKTPISKQEIEIKTYLTAGEEMEIQKVLLNAVEIQQGVVSDIKGSKADIMIEMEKKLMELAIVSIDGKKENIVETLLNMRSSDYDKIKAEVDGIRVPREVKKN